MADKIITELGTAHVIAGPGVRATAHLHTPNCAAHRGPPCDCGYMSGPRLWSSARAAMTAGDGYFYLGDRPSIDPLPGDGFAAAFLSSFAEAFGQTYEEMAAGWQASWDSLFQAWLRGHLGYDPQLLLPPSCFTCRVCGSYGCFIGGPDDTKGICTRCCGESEDGHEYNFEGQGDGWRCSHCYHEPPREWYSEGPDE